LRRLKLAMRLWLSQLGLLLLLVSLVIWLALPWSAVLAVAAFVLLFALAQHYLLRPLWREIAALNLQAQNLQDGSFNVDANQQLLRELIPLANALSDMSQQLRQERASLYQRELLLDTVLQSSPMALLLTDSGGRLLLANPAARQLLWQGRRCDGMLLMPQLQQVPALAQAIAKQQDGLLYLGEPASIWHLSVSQFYLNQQQHQLYLIKPLTQELHREEVKAWKKLLRVIGHELNNTLAPLSSLAFSGEQLATAQADVALQRIFQTIRDRTKQLNLFLQAYIEFAKLPPPSRSLVNWPRLINQLQDQYEFELLGDLPRQPWQLDVQQLSQLLLNLLKNAHESGSTVTAICMTISEKSGSEKTVSQSAGSESLTKQQPTSLLIQLQDAGGGLSDEVLSHATLPFYTTKANGSGIGLTLCRDIAQGHGGSLQLSNHQQGLLVGVELPAAENLLLHEPMIPNNAS